MICRIAPLLMACLCAAAWITSPLRAGDQPQWGQKHTRNMISDEKGVADDFTSGAEAKGVKWTARLGSITYATPIVAEGKVLVGTNNRHPRDDRHQGDRGVLMCFNEADGKFLWQLMVPKLKSVKYGDWHYCGISSSPVAEGSRVYVASNRCEVLCLDINGLADGNAGPYRDEGQHMAAPGKAAFKPLNTDADIIWRFDMKAAPVGAVPHNATNCSILVDGDLLYVSTANGVEWTHRKVANPKAPSIVVLNKKSGKLVAVDDANIGPDIFHCQWSSATLGKVGDKKQIFFGGGDGLCYGFEALAPSLATGGNTLKTIWKFTCDTTAHKVPGGASSYPKAPDSPTVIVSMPVFYKNRVYVAAGGDPWHGKRLGGLYCIDATKRGDITKSGRIWSYMGLGQSISTVSIKDGLVYIASYGGRIHCLDAETGKLQWSHDTGGEIYGSTMVVDGKVYVGTGMRRRGDLWILAAGKTKKVIRQIRLDAVIHSTPTVANGTLYVATGETLYAVDGGRKSK